jgi:radical SAM superfamily enzyme YgiQ (UPF0313 family)
MQTTVDAVGARSLMPSATLATLVALTPDDVAVEYRYCDENVAPLDPDLDCDLVALTGMTLHEPRLAELSRHFRGRGIPVALGGAFASLDTDRAAPLADHLFVGEAERTWPAFLRDLARGEARPRYEQPEHVDLAESPPPDWRFIRGRDYLYLTVQASRGCPNRCDFCDAIQLVGRRYRKKSVDQVLTEIDRAYRAGAETIFFSEDNFYVNRRYTRELLERIVQWNTAQDHPIQFSCQASVRIADDEEILRLLADARFAVVFLGVESLRRECLEEVNKGHLYREDLEVRLARLAHYGLLPFLGMIVGFDADDEASFDEIEAFIQRTASPIVSLSVLNAPQGTPLYQRMAAQGRIDESFDGVWHVSTNIVPRRFTRPELLQRHHRLFSRLYDPERFEPRARRWLSQVGYFTPLYTRRRRRLANLTKIGRVLRYYLRDAPPPVRRMFFRLLWHTARRDKRLIRKAITLMTQYCHYYQFAHQAPAP